MQLEETSPITPGKMTVASDPESHLIAETQKTTDIVRRLSDSPRILLIDDFLSDAECEHLIQLAQNQLDRSLSFDVNTGVGQLTDYRTSSHCWLLYGQDSVVAQLESRIAQLTNIPAENGERLSILRYQRGQEYKAHYDYFDPKYPGSKTALGCGGQRVATVLLYLSNVEEGGETVFPLLDLAIKPKKGTLLYFSNTLANGDIDSNSLHAGVPVKSGQKWLATKWLRQRTCQQVQNQTTPQTAQPDDKGSPVDRP